MPNFKYISHGLDNYEELIDLDEIIFVRTCWELPGGNADNDWTGKTEIIFKNGKKETIYLTEEGFKKLVEDLTKNVSK